LGTGGGEAAVAGEQSEQFLNQIYGCNLVLPRRFDKLPTRDVLADALAQVPGPQCTYQVRGSQLVIVPAYRPPGRPGFNPLDPWDQTPGDKNVPLISDKLLSEQIYGGVVSVTAENKPLTEILSELRAQTGANIVLDPRCQAQAEKVELSISLNDVRLYDALKVIADMAELKLVYAGNIYYVTTGGGGA
jgi:hypothetical protein